jgi:hypothetical protein
MLSMQHHLGAACLVLACAGVSLAQTPQATQAPAALDIQRQERIAEFRDVGMPNADHIRAAANKLFIMPVEQQDESDLKTLARDANAYASMVGMIDEEYGNERRQNLKYDLVTRPIGRASKEYNRIENEFKGYRNTAFMNLAQKAEAKGDMLQAFMYYRDAYRLSAFPCVPLELTDDSCPRLVAEKAMQRILGISNVVP